MNFGALALRPRMQTTRELWAKGIFRNPLPPRSAPRVAVTVTDRRGWGIGSCYREKSHLYLLFALRKMDCRVWVSHAEAGSVLFVEEGQIARDLVAIGLRFRCGERLVFSADGPDAERAVQACRLMFEAGPKERRDVYRQLRKRE